jgi:hypothetical protein
MLYVQCLSWYRTPRTTVQSLHYWGLLQNIRIVTIWKLRSLAWGGGGEGFGWTCSSRVLSKISFFYHEDGGTKPYGVTFDKKGIPLHLLRMHEAGNKWTNEVVWRVDGMILTGGRHMNWLRTCRSASLATTTNPTLTDRGSNLVLHGEKPATAHVVDVFWHSQLATVVTWPNQLIAWYNVPNDVRWAAKRTALRDLRVLQRCEWDLRSYGALCSITDVS